MALALCRELPVRQAANLLHCADKQLWRRIEFYVSQAPALDSYAGVQTVGIDETSQRRGQNYITLVHDLDAKRLLFANEGRDHQTVLDFAADLKAHGGDPAEVRHVCMDISAAYAKGEGLALPQAEISYDRFHVIAMADEAMEQVRRAEMQDDAPAVRTALGTNDRKTLKQLLRGMRRNPASWSKARGMTGNRSDAYMEAMNSLLQQAKRAARGFRPTANSIAIAYLRMSRLKHLPALPFAPASAA